VVTLWWTTEERANEIQMRPMSSPSAHHLGYRLYAFADHGLEEVRNREVGFDASMS